MNMTSLTCKFLRSYTDIWQGNHCVFIFFFPFPFCFDFSIEKCHWSGNSPWLLSSSAFFHRASGLNVLPSYVFQAVWFVGFRERCYITNTNLFCSAFFLWLYFNSTFCVIPDARNHYPQASLKRYKSSPPLFQPCQDDILLLFLPCGGKNWLEEEWIKDECRNMKMKQRLRVSSQAVTFYTHTNSNAIWCWCFISHV